MIFKTITMLNQMFAKGPIQWYALYIWDCMHFPNMVKWEMC